MPEATFLHEGRRIDYTPSGAAVVAGQVVVLGDIVGVADLPIADGALGALSIEGVYTIAKGTGAGTDFAAGVPLWWDNTNNIVAETDGSGTHKKIGYAAKAAGTADATCLVKLSR